MSEKANVINGRYQLHEQLGQGGMGVVHRATDRLTGDTIALKQVTIPHSLHVTATLASNATTGALRLALAHEFQIMAGLRHPHIISVLDYGFDAQQQPFFTMSYLPDAQTILEYGKQLPLTEKISLLQQLLQALAYLHQQQILHRDIKPENVLVTGDTVRVLDFGLAASRGTDSVTSSGGTLLYLAPEIWGNQPFTAATDLFAVGIIACQLLAGHHPFGPIDHLLMDRVLDAEPDLAGMDAQLQPVVAQLLAKKPEARYPNAFATIAALSEALDQPLPVETAAIRESYLQAATFVGREAEMAQLTAALAQAKTSNGSSWLVGGESGVGKSRLLEELRIRALVDGFLVLRGQAVEGSGGLPYQLWRAPVRRLLLDVAADDLMASVLVAIVPDIQDLLGRSVSSPPELDGKAAQQRFYSTVTQLFQQQQQPILLLLEDLQWAAESLEVLKQLNRLATGLPLLIVANYRNDEVSQLPDTLSGMTPLSLSRLSSNEMVALSTAVLGPAGQQPEVLNLLQRETEGNAFFLVETVRALAKTAGRLQAIGEMDLPPALFPAGIQTIVQRRLQQVPPPAHALLQLAAIAGQELDLRVLATLATVPKTMQPLLPDPTPQITDDGLPNTNYGLRLLEPWLTTCHAAAVLTVQDQTWRFVHSKLRDGLLAQLNLAQHQSHHRQVATAIAETYPADPAQAATLAYHWQQAGDTVQERHFTYLAGEYAAAQYANTAAIRFFSRAYQLTPASNLQQRYDCLLAREKLYALVGKRDAQQQDLDLLVTLAAQLNPQAQITVWLRQSAYLNETGDYERSTTTVQTTMQQAQAIGNNSLLAQSYLLWGRVLYNQGQYASAARQLTTGLQLAQVERDTRMMANCLRNLGNVSYYQSRYVEAVSYYEQSLTIYREIDDRRGEAASLGNLGTVAYQQGNYVQAVNYYEQSMTIKREIGDRRGEANSRNSLGLVAFTQGNYAQSINYCKQSLAISREIDDRRGEADSCINLGLVAKNQGNYAQTVDYYEQSLTIRREIGDRRGEALSLNNLGVVAFAQGNYAQTINYCKQSLTIAREIGYHDGEANTLNYLGMVAYQQDNYVQAVDYHEQALAIEREIGNHSGEAFSLNCLGAVAYSQGNYEQAVTYYEQSQAIRAELNQPHYLVEDWAGLAQVSVAQKNNHAARQYIQQVLDCLHQNPHLEGAENRMRTFHFTWETLVTLGQTADSTHVLTLAAKIMQEYLDKNPDPAAQEMYLNQPHHKVLWAAWQQHQQENPI